MIPQRGQPPNTHRRIGGRSFLPAIRGAVVMTGSNMKSTWPPITSCSAGVEPL